MKKLKLKDLFFIRKGKKVDPVKEPTPDTVRYIQIEDLRDNSKSKYCLKNNSYVCANKNDIIIAWDGANAGTVSYGLEGVVGSTLAVLETESKEIYIPFIGKLLQSKFRYLQDTCTGATIPHISRNALENLLIPIPSLEVQKLISETIDNAKIVIDKRKLQIEALDQLTQSVFLEMFGDPILNKKLWPKEKLGKLCTVVRGGSPRPIEKYLGGSVPWIKIGDAPKGDSIYLRGTKEKIKEEGIKKSRFIKEGSLIFANCGVSLGFARITTFDGCIHDGWLAFQDISVKINKIFLLKLLNQFTDYFRRTAPDGTQPNLNTTIMKNFEVIIPPLDIQEKFVEIIIDIEFKKELFQKSLTELEHLNHSLIQRTFKGELLNEEKVSNF